MDALQEVEVQNTLTGGWTPGFVVVDTLHNSGGDAVRLRRQSDGLELPATISVDRVRATKPMVGTR